MHQLPISNHCKEEFIIGRNVRNQTHLCASEKWCCRDEMRQGHQWGFNVNFGAGPVLGIFQSKYVPNQTLFNSLRQHKPPRLCLWSLLSDFWLLWSSSDTAGVLKAWLSLCRCACGCSPCWSHCIMRLSSELWGRGCTGCSGNAPLKAEANSSAFQLWILPLRWSAPGLVSRADAAARQVSPCFHECVPLWKVEVENEISDL